MLNSEIEKFVYMSSDIGSHHDYVQGGGGNTSYKLDERFMAVKASGFRLDQITDRKGFVILDYVKIAGYFSDIGTDAAIDREEESSMVIRGSMVPYGYLPPARPSVEAGFHSLLKRAVIHSHSVYANMICCSVEGKSLLSEIFGKDAASVVYIPYVDPGFALTLAIKEGVGRSFSASGVSPGIIFMENHGLTVTCSDAAGCLELHESANDRIKKYFKIEKKYPFAELAETETGHRSITEYIYDFTERNALNRDYIESNILYPDQIVYLNNNRSIDFRSDGIYYYTGEGEANTIEETLLAYVYAIGMIKKAGLTLRTMPGEGIRFINSWESEKFRKQVAEKSGK